MNNITTYNEGGSHSQNPNGGIPMGQSPEGQMNTVEEGEARMGDMIYSDRIPLSQEAVEAVGLPRKFIGKTPGSIMTLIDKTFKDRNDTPSQATKKDIADKVAQAQEMIKAQQQAMQTQSQEVPDMMNGQVPQGMEEFTQNQMSFGGFFKGQQGQNNMSTLGTGMSGVGYGMTQGENTVIAGDTKDNQMVDGTKDAVASAIGPIGQMFRGVQKMGQGIGNSIGGEAGAGVADAFSPEESTIAMWKDKDASTLEKIGGTVPILGGVIAHRAKKEKQNKEMIKNVKMQHSNLTSDFAKGGPINNGGEGSLGFRKPLNTIPQIGAGENYVMINPEVSQVSAFTMPGASQGLKYPNMTPEGEVLKIPIATSDTTDNKNQIDWKNLANKAGTFAKNNYANAMRLAPVAVNASELARLKRKGYDKVNPILNDTRFKPEYIDEKSALNLANSEMNNTINSISQLGGSQGATRNSILAASLNRGKQLSQSMIDAQGRNIATNQAGQQFNNQINEANIQRRTIAEDLTARNKGAYETNRSKLVSQIGTDIGRIGKEEVFKKIAENMTGYDWLGNYIKANPNATEQEVLQAAVEYTKKNKNLFKNRPVIDTTPIKANAYGGKMKFKKY
jgi:hypothetical protein